MMIFRSFSYGMSSIRPVFYRRHMSESRKTFFSMDIFPSDVQTIAQQPFVPTIVLSSTIPGRGKEGGEENRDKAPTDRCVQTN